MDILVHLYTNTNDKVGSLGMDSHIRSLFYSECWNLHVFVSIFMVMWTFKNEPAHH